MGNLAVRSNHIDRLKAGNYTGCNGCPPVSGSKPTFQPAPCQPVASVLKLKNQAARGELPERVITQLILPLRAEVLIEHRPDCAAHTLLGWPPPHLPMCRARSLRAACYARRVRISGFVAGQKGPRVECRVELVRLGPACKLMQLRAHRSRLFHLPRDEQGGECELEDLEERLPSANVPQAQNERPRQLQGFPGTAALNSNGR